MESKDKPDAIGIIKFVVSLIPWKLIISSIKDKRARKAALKETKTGKIHTNMATMYIIRQGNEGETVRLWQLFLIGQGYDAGEADGRYGLKTFNATVIFQKENGIPADGIVGPKTYAKAMLLGYDGTDDTNFDETTKNWPPAPSSLSPVVGNAAKERFFGTTGFTLDESGKVVLNDSWASKNLKMIDVPQLSKVSTSGGMYFYAPAEKQLQLLWKQWEDAGLLHLVLTYSGSYNPRLIRGSSTSLSMHAYGAAFDINVAWNKLGAVPALVGEHGEVRSLVEIANKCGFYWGGHFKNRPDGMHFEIAKIL